MHLFSPSGLLRIAVILQTTLHCIPVQIPHIIRRDILQLIPSRSVAPKSVQVVPQYRGVVVYGVVGAWGVRYGPRRAYGHLAMIHLEIAQF